MNNEGILLLIVAGFGLFFGSFIGYGITSDYFHQEIVDRGFAEWQIVTGTSEVEFKWKENK
jgi:hypothetical protein